MGIRDIITKWEVRGIAKTQHRIFRLTQQKNPSLSEAEISPLIFIRRMGKVIATKSQQFRIDTYFDINPPIHTLREACHAIAVVEHRIHPEDSNNVKFLTEIIDKELNRLGYTEEKND